MRFNRGYMLSKEEFCWLEEILEEAFDKQLQRLESALYRNIFI